MNCQPGDLAYIVAPASRVHGRYVTVLSPVPETGVYFMLPDGCEHHPLGDDLAPWWLCEFCNPVDAPFGPITRRTRFAPVPDMYLRPIRDPGDDATDELLRPLPKEEPAHA